MATPKLKLVPAERERQPSSHSTKSPEFYSPWKQEFRGLSQLASTLTGLLLGAILLGAFLYAYSWVQQKGRMPTRPPNPNEQEFLVVTGVYIHSEPNVSKNTRIGVCDQGARVRVVGTQAVGKRVWYEIKILSEHPKNLDSANRNWVAAECLTMLRQ